MTVIVMKRVLSKAAKKSNRLSFTTVEVLMNPIQSAWEYHHISRKNQTSERVWPMSLMESRGFREWEKYGHRTRGRGRSDATVKLILIPNQTVPRKSTSSLRNDEWFKKFTSIVQKNPVLGEVKSDVLLTKIAWVVLALYYTWANVDKRNCSL